MNQMQVLSSQAQQQWEHAVICHRRPSKGFSAQEVTSTRLEWYVLVDNLRQYVSNI